MASMSFAVGGLGYSASSNPCCQQFQAFSSSHCNKLSSDGFCSRITPFASHRNAAVSCASDEAQMLALSAESRRRLVDISDSKRHNIVSKVVTSLGSAQLQGLQRCVVQISAVLVLTNSFYSNIAPPNPYDTLENVPQDLSGGEERKRIQRPKSKKAERCTQKCLGTCIRGGAGSPGEGPFNIRKPLVVFKEGFRTRQYCLIECSEICNLIGDGDDGP